MNECVCCADQGNHFPFIYSVALSSITTPPPPLSLSFTPLWCSWPPVTISQWLVREHCAYMHFNQISIKIPNLKSTISIPTSSHIHILFSFFSSSDYKYKMEMNVLFGVIKNKTWNAKINNNRINESKRHTGQWKWLQRGFVRRLVLVFFFTFFLLICDSSVSFAAHFWFTFHSEPIIINRVIWIFIKQWLRKTDQQNSPDD